MPSLGCQIQYKKTEIIPIGSLAHRACIHSTHKINPLDQSEFKPQIRITPDGTAVLYLEAWIGDNVNEATPWEAVIDKIDKSLTLWKKAYPSMARQKLIM